jgi:Fe-S-cluster containining protein
MRALRFAPGQRFSCAQCGRCCRRTTVLVTTGEVEAYRKAGAARWFREDDGAAEGGADPFEPIPGHAPLLRIRKRQEGTCGFLSPEGRCRIHEVLGADRKPLACRMFPFRFRQVDDEAVVSVSFACPTVIANQGATLASQERELQTLHAAWRREFPEAPATIELVRGHRLTRAALAQLRAILGQVLDRPGPDGRPDLRANLRRIAALLEDLSRRRVLGLAPDDWVEYLRLTGGYAIKSEKPLPARAPSPLARLLFRGFLLAVLSVQIHLDPVLSRRRLALRVTLVRLLAHLHGLGPAAAGFDLRRAITMPLRLDDPAVHAIAHRYLRAGFETLGAGRRTVLDEIAMTVAQLNAACVLAGRHAAANEKREVDAESFTQGLLESADLSHADAGGRLSGFLTTLSGSVEALYLFPPLAGT